jgi:hypothetical protein
MKKTILLLMGLIYIATFVDAQTVPTPSAYFNFNTDWFTVENHNAIPLDMGTKVNDNSGNGLYAAWYNYNSVFPSLYSGYNSTGGKFNGAAYFAGYKSLCNVYDNDGNLVEDNGAAAQRDVLFFAGNASKRTYASNVIDTSRMWQGVRTAFTVAYWWKSDRAIEGNQINACPPDEYPDWGEEETQFDGGAFNGIDIMCWYNFFKFGWRNGSDGVDVAHKTDYFMPANGVAPDKGEWVHVAITFDGSTGLLAFYLNGELAIDYDGNESGNPNPVQTGYSQFDAVTFDENIVSTARGAVLFGATNGASPSGQNSGGEFWGEVPQYEGKYGYIEDHYRLGWGARGYLDEFAYWKNVALTQTQIQYIMANEIDGLISTGINNGSKVNDDLLAVFPNISNGSFTVKVSSAVGGNLSVVNMVGTTVYEQTIAPDENIVNLNLTLSKGMYLVKFDSDNQCSIDKVIIR